MRYLRHVSFCLTLVPFLISLGCGGAAPLPIKENTAPKHGGRLFPLGDESKGYLEFVVEKANASKKTQVSMYFMAEDGAGPLNPTPTDVSLIVEGGKTVVLKADAGTPGKFVSDVGVPIAAGHEVAGEIVFKLGGRETKIAILSR